MLAPNKIVCSWFSFEDSPVGSDSDLGSLVGSGVELEDKRILSWESFFGSGSGEGSGSLDGSGVEDPSKRMLWSMLWWLSPVGSDSNFVSLIGSGSAVDEPPESNEWLFSSFFGSGSDDGFGSDVGSLEDGSGSAEVDSPKKLTWSWWSWSSWSSLEWSEDGSAEVLSALW